MRTLMLGMGLAGLVGAVTLAPLSVRAATKGPSIPFEAAIATSTLVGVATTELRTDGAILVPIESVLVRRSTLEDVFLTLTGRTLVD